MRPTDLELVLELVRERAALRSEGGRFNEK
jgi:hypothetical protein